MRISLYGPDRYVDFYCDLSNWCKDGCRLALQFAVFDCYTLKLPD
jgi:hypothetical protein